MTEKEIKYKKHRTWSIALVISGILVLTSCLVVAIVLSFLDAYAKIIIIASGLAYMMATAFIALYLENLTGVYECPKCHEKHEASYGKVLASPHVGSTRYMKCPHCNEKGWHRKVIE